MSSDPNSPVPADVPAVDVPLTGEANESKDNRVRIGTQRAGSGPVRAKAQFKGGEERPEPKAKVAVPNRRQRMSDEMELELVAAFGDATVDDLLVDKGDKANREIPPESKCQGRVAMVHNDDVFVELGGRNQGVLSLRQFTDPPEIGAIVEVIVDRYLPEEAIYQIRLPQGAVQVGDWSEISDGMFVEVRVTGHNKGGLECEVSNLRAFMPAGQVSPYRVEDLSTFVGQKLTCLVTECNPDRRNLVVSRRAVVEYEQSQAREKLWTELEEGQVREGTVRSLMDFGAFVDLGGVDGLIHISQMSWKRIKHPNELLKVGDSVKVLVRKIDRETRKVGLTLRDLAGDPWTNIQDKYPVGSIARGSVTRVMEFGAFVEIEPGVEGLVHISELSHGRVFRVTDFIKEGDTVEAKVVSLDPDERRIGLSMKALQSRPEKKKADDEPAEEETVEPIVRKHTGPLKGGASSGKSEGAKFGLKW